MTTSTLKRYYAGIGSRLTPEPVLAAMRDIARRRAENGWVLRSGAANGADAEFEAGALLAQGECEIFLPWRRFNGHLTGIDTSRSPMLERAFQLAAQHHPAWDRCSPAAKKLHARNCFQVLGPTLDQPVDDVLC